MFKFNPINKSVFTAIVRNIIFTLKKTGAFDTITILNLQNKVNQNPEQCLGECMKLLKDAKKRVVKPFVLNDRNNRGENNNDNI